MSDKYNEFPDHEHYAAIVFKTKSIYHDPAYTETVNFVEYISFRNKAEMEQQVSEWEMKKYEKPLYKIILASPLSVEFSAKVNIK